MTEKFTWQTKGSIYNNLNHVLWRHVILAIEKLPYRALLQTVDQPIENAVKVPITRSIRDEISPPTGRLGRLF